MKRLIIISISILSSAALNAQKKSSNSQVFDTTKKTVVITSAYKPVLKPANKINFTAAVPTPDSSKPALLNYNVPAQNLFFTYQPVSLKPLALSVDSVMEWVNSNYVKAGYGNYKTPYAEVGLSYGNGKTSLVNFHGRHISQKGSIPFQQYAHTSFDIMGLHSTSAKLELRGKIGFDRRSQYYYGFQPDTLKYTKDSLRQTFGTISGMVGLRNKEVNSLGVSYDPTIAISVFSDNRAARETNFVLNTPLSKTITPDVAINLGFTADITNYKRFNGEKIKNNLYYISPGLVLKKSTFTLNAGVTPSWDNGQSHLLPNIVVNGKLKNEKFVVQAGWIGYYQKNSYQTLAAFNPWIAQPVTLFNTRLSEQFAGFKGSAGSHFTYNGKLAVVNYKNAVLFVNDTTDGKTFEPTYEEGMKSLRISGEVGYTVQEKFSLLGGIVINKYSGLKTNAEAWGLIPLELTGSLRWQVLKDLQFKSDVFLWNGPLFRTKGGDKEREKGAFDLNAGAEFSVVPGLNVWLQLNNIFNNKYERWNQYQVLGLNVIGGLVYSF